MLAGLPNLFRGELMVLVVAAYVVLVFSKACFINFFPKLVSSGLGVGGAGIAGREAAWLCKSAVSTSRQSGDQRRDS